ncbi:MAG: hypothetical protein KDK40_04495 [Chlamydiia bacterium]|nr:hypothetical protein [Chlamydiia bacterium]
MGDLLPREILAGHWVATPPIITAVGSANKPFCLSGVYAFLRAEDEGVMFCKDLFNIELISHWSVAFVRVVE